MPAHARIAGRRTVRLADLSPAGRHDLGTRLFAIHSQIFAGVSEERFREHVLNAPAAWVRIQTYCDEAGEIVGYCAVRAYRRRLRGRPCTVIRAAAGLKPGFRGRGTTYWFGMVCALREKLRHPLTPLYYLDTLVHTSSYHLFCKYFRHVYPEPDRPLPEAVRRVVLELVDTFDEPVVDPADPMVRDDGWITIETPEERELQGHDDLADVAFYKRRNPGYVRGHGLVVVVPLGFADIAVALARRIAELILPARGAGPPGL